MKNKHLNKVHTSGSKLYGLKILVAITLTTFLSRAAEVNRVSLQLVDEILLNYVEPHR
jgi:hypothetical protein